MLIEHHVFKAEISSKLEMDISRDFEKQDQLIFEMEGLKDTLGKSDDRIFYFDRYIDRGNRVYFGFHNFSSGGVARLDEFLSTLEKSREIKTYKTQNGDEVDTKPIDDMGVYEIKGEAYKLYATVRKKLSINQTSALLHYFMNQVGYTLPGEDQIRKSRW